MKISGVYKITNTVTGDFYIGSSNDVKRRYAEHKKPSSLKKQPNNQLYQDMQKYGLDKFDFQVIAEVEVDSLKEMEQQFIELLKPAYNNINAKGIDIERQKKSQKKADNKYYNQLCCYNNETLTLGALKMRFMRQGIEHSTAEAKKYLLVKSKDNIKERK